MPADSALDPTTPLKSIVRLFALHGVEYLVIGGQAEALMGSARVTYDVDLCYRRSGDNIARLAAALEQIDPSLRGAPIGLPFKADARTIASGQNFTFDTRLGPLDLLGHVEPIGGFEELLPLSEQYDVQGVRIRTIGLEDLLNVKRHIRRAKDTESMVQLELIQGLRARGLA